MGRRLSSVHTLLLLVGVFTSQWEVIYSTLGLGGLLTCKTPWNYDSKHRLCTRAKDKDCDKLDKDSKAKEIEGIVLCTLAAVPAGNNGGNAMGGGGVPFG